jgi:hypothetical protein
MQWVSPMRPSTPVIRAVIVPSLSLLCWAGTGLPACAQAQSSAEGIEFFEKKIRPLLAAHCYTCHSAKAEKLRGGLRLDTRERILAGGDSGPAVVPGDPDGSLLIKAIRYTDPDRRMPPAKKLSREDVADLEAWVKRGAPVPRAEDQGAGPGASGKHWAFQAPKVASVPQVKGKGGVQNPIDCFVLAKLEAKGLQPAAPVDKRTLLRRATLDLIGLPPTAAEVEAFVQDDSPTAFAKVVDRLLASPRYGERWGRHWLDLVRYTDDFDEAWRYRDWVVEAFNRDLPYDQFTVHQIAGDRLPAPDANSVNAEGIVATTMLSIGPWGGIDRKKRMADIVDDQIDTVGRTFLAMTLACARCHDHKFDPLTTADYYGLAGIFYSSRVIADEVYLSHGTQRLRVPLVPPAEVEKHRQHLVRIHRREKKLQDEVERHYSDFARSLLPQVGQYLQAAWEYPRRPAEQAGMSVKDFALKRGLRPFALEQWVRYLGERPFAQYRPLHMPVRNYDGEPGVHAWGASAERPWWGVNTNRHEVAIETFLLPPRTLSVNPGVDGGAVSWKSPFTGRIRITGRLVDGDPYDGTGVTWVVDHVSEGVRSELSSGSMPSGSLTLDQGRHAERLAAVDVKAGDIISLGVWLRQGDAHYDITNVELSIARLDRPGRWELPHDVLDNLLEANPHRDSLGHGGVWSFEDMAGSNRKARMPAVDRALAGLNPATPDAAGRAFQSTIDAGGDRPLVRDLTGVRSPFWVRERDDGQYLSAEARASLNQCAAELEALRRTTPPLPSAHGAQEGGPRFSIFPGIGDAQIHVRGRYDQLGAVVPRRFPLTLAGDQQPPITSGSGRLELARWIASAQNPLTARVLVNRVWQQHFGEGIVRTASNFGQLGTPPTHAELLDWLAQRLVESGWSIKALHRLILLSATYQQSSHPSAELLKADPDNLLLGRMNRRPLAAEALRDSLLAVCGQLDPRPGGPASPADDRQGRRRMIYLKSSRTDRSGFGALFDAADASIHVEKRSASTVAPQALYLMNNPLVLDAVQHLANTPANSRGSLEERIQAFYRSIFGRSATADELAVGLEFIDAQKAPPAAAAAPPRRAEVLSAWEVYAQMLLMSNEFLFVE